MLQNVETASTFYNMKFVARAAKLAGDTMRVNENKVLPFHKIYLRKTNANSQRHVIKDKRNVQYSSEFAGRLGDKTIKW